MPLQATPSYIGAEDYLTPVENDRQLVKNIFGRRQGVLGSADFQVTQAPSGMAVRVNSGAAVCGDKEAATQGFYFAWSDSQEDVPWPGPSGQPRIDALILRIVDPQYGTTASTTGAKWEIIQGTPAASPTAPSDSTINNVTNNKPGAWLRVADVRINTSDTTSIPAARITDRRVYASSGTLLATNEASLPTVGVQMGQGALTMDNKWYYVWNGSAWMRFANADEVGLGVVARVSSAGSGDSNAFGTTGINLPNISINNFVFKANRRYRLDFFGSFRMTSTSIIGIQLAIIEPGGQPIDSSGAQSGSWTPTFPVATSTQPMSRTAEARFTSDTTKTVQVRAGAYGGSFIQTDRHTLMITDLGKLV
jgi:hypothetical protein